MSVVGSEAIDMHGGWARHRLDATSHNDVLHARENAHGCEVHCLLARATEAVQGDARGFNGPASIKCGHTCDIHGVITAAGTTTHDNVIDFCGVKTHAVTKAIEDLGKDALGVHVVQGA